MTGLRRSSRYEGPEVPGRLAAVFPTPGRVPPEHRMPAPLEQGEFLVGGRLRTWEGPRRDV